VDLDYKLMSNAGTWMVGRLQTERDKARIIEALRSASGIVDTKAWDARISGLGKRQFVLKTARSAEPSLFTTRWAVSYLRGPFTRSELLRLRDLQPPPGGVEGAEPPRTEEASPREPSSPRMSPTDSGVHRGDPTQPSLGPDESPIPPAVADGISVRFLDPSAPWAPDVGVVPGGRRLEAGLAARVNMLFDDQRGDLRHEDEWEAVFFPLGESVQAEEARILDHDPRDFQSAPPQDAVYALPRAAVDSAAFFRGAEGAIQEYLYRELTLTLFRNSSLKLYSRVGESESAFLERCLAKAEDRADADAEKLRDRFEKRLETARDRASNADRRVRELEVDTEQRRQQELIAGAGEVLSMFLGGRRRTRSLSGMASRRSQTRRTRERLRSAQEKLADYQEDIEELEEELTEELEEIWEKWREVAERVESFQVGLEKTDIHLDDLFMFWAPVG
jgi:hypothetical protein